MESENSSSNVTAPVTTVITRSSLPFKISYFVVALMFLMPFVEFRCNGVTLTKASGIDLAFGFEMKESKTVNNWNKSFNQYDAGYDQQNAKRERKEPNSYALASLVLAVMGLGVSFLKTRAQPFLSMVIGILGALALIVLMIQLNSDIRNEITTQGADYGVKISYDYTAWFFFALIGFLVAGFTGWRQVKKKQPVKGPQ